MNRFSPSSVDVVWQSLSAEARRMASRDEPLARSLARPFEGARGLGEVLAVLLARFLADPLVPYDSLRVLLEETFAQNPQSLDATARDLLAVRARDPAAEGLLRPLLFFKGVAAIQTHRAAHVLWHAGARDSALHLQSRSSVVFGVDIHPAARLGAGVMMVHATGVVIGETAVVEDDVSILHGVTLGGTGHEHGDRHPKIRRGVMLGAGAKVLGNIDVGEGACIAAGSVVLKPVPARVTVAGVPAQVVGPARSDDPAKAMDQTI